MPLIDVGASLARLMQLWGARLVRCLLVCALPFALSLSFVSSLGSHASAAPASLVVALTAPTWQEPTAVSSSEAVDFDTQIQPLLARHCLQCHGSDAPEGGLDLTVPDPNTRSLLSPGDPDGSELLARVTANDSDLRMPPTGPPLSADQTDKLRRWIDQGAIWPEHWSYRPLNPLATPELQRAELRQWSSSPLDAAIAASFEREELQPVPFAERRALLRRLTFDLHGVAPEPEALRRFEAQNRPDAVEREVDRLLASPRFGERQARHWMDQVHFAETHGHDQDRPRDHAWPYRDYLIHRFNDDIDYRQFVQEQIAGDALWPADPWATVATGMLAAGPWDESSLRDIREDAPDRVAAQYLDRDDIVTTVMSTFAGTSVQCARCHDHKFDPISQADYYGLQAIFSATDKANRVVELDRELGERREALASLLEQWRQVLTANSAAPEPIDDAWLNERVQVLSEVALRWESPPLIEVDSLGGATEQRLPDGSVRFEGARPDKDNYRFIVPLNTKRLTAVRLEVLADETLPAGGPGRCDNGNLHVTEWQVYWRSGPDAHWIELPLKSCIADFDQTGWTAAHAIDGNPTTAWGIFPKVNESHQLIGMLHEPLEVSSESAQLRVDVLQAHGGAHLIGRARIGISEADSPQISTDALPAEPLRSLLVNASAQWSRAEREQLAAWFKIRELEQELAALPPKSLVYCGTHQFTAEGSFRPAPEGRLVQVLRRGLTSDPLGDAEPGAIEFLEQQVPFLLSDGERGQDEARRIALAAWLIDDAHPLTWRVMANRVWLQHFGSGLVTTPNDFGRMGSAPSHPWLLDRLADELRRSGSLKRLHRQLVTSSAYRLSSLRDPQNELRDAQAIYRWRMPRRRLDAESVRDSLLQISGVIDWRMGGPSVRQFTLSPGVHVTPVVNYETLALDAPEYRRRSVYRFLFRTVPDPFFDALDCPDASQWTPERSVSLTAIQALATLHDRQVAWGAERLAERLMREVPSDPQRVQAIFEWLYARGADSTETEIVMRFVEQHGWGAACLYLCNLNEFHFVD